ncbi:MAG: hypothetical protein L0G63_01145 [Psychrobacter sp.]|uniref:hypothetical protein n=1 Tax=Psychrobacter sp. TaxID=56811 RepID=UPI00264A0CD5|nr:hypothetical protein [Psychrobacter sp.]MDN5619075.1 hypothetical protein [Psychrobacter sp.]
MSCKKIKAKLKKKGIKTKELYSSRCAYGGGWSYFVFLADGVEPDILDIDPNCEIESQFDSSQEALDWIEQLPNLKG